MGKGTKICTTLKDLKACLESHVGAVLIDTENITRNDSKINVMTEAGYSKSVMLFNREVRFLVTIGEYKLETLEPIFEEFMLSLDKGIVLPNGYYVTIETGENDWLSKDDSILKAEISAVLTVICKGGIYKNLSFSKLTDITSNTEEEK